MLYSRFLTIVSRESALKTIRRASGFFIWTSIIVLGLNLFPHFDSWSHSQAKANSTGSAEMFGSLIGFMLGRVVYNDWTYILFLVNGFVLRRYKSRVAATLFILVGLYVASVGLFLIWKILQDPSPVSMYLVLLGVFLVVLFGSYVWIAWRALAATIKLRGQFKDAMAPNTIGP